MTDIPFIHPDRPRPRFRPFQAMRHFRNLIRNKEDTEQVFHIFQCLPRRGFRDDARAFIGSDAGRALYASEPNLPDLLDDHDRLRAMPVGSVAHAYCDFMEKEGLSAAGLVAEYAKFDPRDYADQFGWYANRSRDTHDLLHILTGYGRDALGEQCVLAFTYGQNPAPANIFIAYAGGLNLKKRVRSDAPVFKAIREAQKLGKACPRIMEQDITALLAEPLTDVRKRFHITPPVHYRQAHEAFRGRGIDPYDLLGQAA